MNLYDEDILNENKKNSTKGTKILLPIIIVLVILCLIIIFLIMFLKNSIINVTIDGVSNNQLRDIIVFEEDNTKIYLPVKRLSAILGCQSYNGEYLNKSEDMTKCYIESKDEVVNIALNSNIITKKELNDKSFFDKIELDEPIKEINGELCASIDGIEKIFNVDFYYDIENKDIQLYTLNYLVDFYIKKLPNYGFEELKEGFANEKAILDNIIIAKNSNGSYGVIKVNGDTILETKYDDIEYLKNTNEFLVTSNEKKGIISYDRKIVLNIEYDNITEVDENLYVITQNDNMGLVSKTGETVIYPKYDYIGLEENEFAGQDDYILLEDLIPIKEDNKWAIFKTDGTQVTQFEYDSLGCRIINNKEVNNVLTIKGYDVFVAQLNNKYYLLNKDGTKTIEFEPGFDAIYSVDNEGVEEFYMIYNNSKTENVVEFFDKIGIKKAE